jgi:hypothetical protein
MPPRMVARTVGLVRARVEIGLADLAYNFTQLPGFRVGTRPPEAACRR